MDKTSLSDKYARILTIQEYGEKVPIDGVSFLPLNYHKDETGEFVELGRFDAGVCSAIPGFNIAQVSWSLLLPGAVKAFHIHFNQADLWYVAPQDRLLVGLLDTRKASPSAEVTMRFILGGGMAQLLYMPAGVAHGAANPWDKPVYMTYFTDRQFNPAAPDEYRLPYDLFGEDFWRLKKG